MKMGDKDKKIWFDALERRAAMTSTKITLYDKPRKRRFKYVIGEQVLVRQTPIAKSQLAIIESVDLQHKKVQVYWICGGYRENIEMYDKLFMNIQSRTRNCVKCPI